MKTRAILLSAVVTAGFAVGLLGTHVIGSQTDDEEEPIVRRELDKRPLGTAEGKQGRVIEVRLAPGAAFSEEPTVQYPAEEFVYVVEGTAILTREDGAVEVEAGESFYNEREEPHTLANASDSEPLKVVAVWIGDEGAF